MGIRPDLPGDPAEDRLEKHEAPGGRSSRKVRSSALGERRAGRKVGGQYLICFTLLADGGRIGTGFTCNGKFTEMNVWIAIFLLINSNVMMSFAWFSHLKTQSESPLIIAILSSWGIAFLEYTLMVPAVRMASQTLTVSQIKILQEAISLTVFIPFMVLYMKENFTWDYVWACLCILLAVFFIFRARLFC